MTVEELAAAVIDACEAEGVDHMITGAFAASLYGVPRSTKDVDVVLSIARADPIGRISTRLHRLVHFDSQVQFDTLTWGRRLIGTAIENEPLKVELFELFDDPFVLEQFSRRKRVFSAQINRETWLPTAEDVIVQKLRWGRSKDLDDALDILAVQGPEALDMKYIRAWCVRHGTETLLSNALLNIPPL